jgi:hypothetical protein
MHVHPKASGHEAHGANFVSGARKKPQNPDEVGAIKDHFSEGRQQENKRQPRQQNAQPEAPSIPFEEVNPAQQNPDDVQKPEHRSHALAAEQAALSLHSLLKEAAPQAETGGGVADHREQPKGPSLDDLLALMRAKP